MDAFTFVLESLDDTARLGTLLAGMMQNAPQVRALLLQGDLGSGKTTLTRSLVAALPGGDQAEISSPSFTICNNYPTCPACPAPTSAAAASRFPTKSGTRWTPMQASASWNGLIYPQIMAGSRNFWTSGWSHAKRDDS